MLDINDDPVMIKQIEWAIIERAFEGGLGRRRTRPSERTGMTVGVVGSGPAGLAAAAELNQVGHEVTVYERDEGPGGLIRFGVPDAKLEKWIIDRRIEHARGGGNHVRVRRRGRRRRRRDQRDELRDRHDAVVMPIGSRVERDLDVPGRELDGVHFAMEYLYQRNRCVAREQGNALARARARRSPPPASTSS